jgi:hypothetical protein
MTPSYVPVSPPLSEILLPEVGTDSLIRFLARVVDSRRPKQAEDIDERKMLKYVCSLRIMFVLVRTLIASVLCYFDNESNNTEYISYHILKTVCRCG